MESKRKKSIIKFLPRKATVDGSQHARRLSKTKNFGSDEEAIFVETDETRGSQRSSKRSSIQLSVRFTDRQVEILESFFGFSPNPSGPELDALCKRVGEKGCDGVPVTRLSVLRWFKYRREDQLHESNGGDGGGQATLAMSYSASTATQQQPLSVSGDVPRFGKSSVSASDFRNAFPNSFSSRSIVIPEKTQDKISKLLQANDHLLTCCLLSLFLSQLGSTGTSSNPSLLSRKGGIPSPRPSSQFSSMSPLISPPNSPPLSSLYSPSSSPAHHKLAASPPVKMPFQDIPKPLTSPPPTSFAPPTLNLNPSINFLATPPPLTSSSNSLPPPLTKTPDRSPSISPPVSPQGPRPSFSSKIPSSSSLPNIQELPATLNPRTTTPTTPSSHGGFPNGNASFSPSSSSFSPSLSAPFPSSLGSSAAVGFGQSKSFEELAPGLLQLHASPLDLFLHHLRMEVEKLKDLAVLLRSSSLSSYLLKYLLSSYNTIMVEKLSGMFKFAGTLTTKKISILTEKSTEEVQKAGGKELGLKKKVEQIMINMLDSEQIPTPLCRLCYRCAEVVQSSSQEIKIGSKVTIANWAVGAVLFLRLVVPIITLHTDDKQKGLRFFGRFLMKLCCKTLFGGDDHAVVNDLLRMGFDLYDTFCDRVVETGRLASRVQSGMNEGKSGISEDWPLCMLDFIQSNTHIIYKYNEHLEMENLMKVASLFTELIGEIGSLTTRGSRFSLYYDTSENMPSVAVDDLSGVPEAFALLLSNHSFFGEFIETHSYSFLSPSDLSPSSSSSRSGSSPFSPQPQKKSDFFAALFHLAIGVRAFSQTYSALFSIEIQNPSSSSIEGLLEPHSSVSLFLDQLMEKIGIPFLQKNIFDSLGVSLAKKYPSLVSSSKYQIPPNFVEETYGLLSTLLIGSLSEFPWEMKEMFRISLSLISSCYSRLPASSIVESQKEFLRGVFVKRFCDRLSLPVPGRKQNIFDVEISLKNGPPGGPTRLAPLLSQLVLLSFSESEKCASILPHSALVESEKHKTVLFLEELGVVDDVSEKLRREERQILLKSCQSEYRYTLDRLFV